MYFYIVNYIRIEKRHINYDCYPWIACQLISDNIEKVKNLISIYITISYKYITYIIKNIKVKFQS
jgi:hypothetical protein